MEDVAVKVLTKSGSGEGNRTLDSGIVDVGIATVVGMHGLGDGLFVDAQMGGLRRKVSTSIRR